MTSSQTNINLIFGGAAFAPHLSSLVGEYDGHKVAKEALELLEANGVGTIDTAEQYTGSEEELGYQGAPARFIIDTKIPGGFKAPRRKDEIIAGVKRSLKSLKVDQVDVLYFHSPETTVPFEEQLSATQELYEQGAFKRLGLSNYTAAQVQEVYDISKKNGWVLPSVYQGNYNPVARGAEKDLVPLLRKLGFVYNAYSPIAGGFLAKTRAQVEDGKGRWDPETTLGKLYGSLYKQESLLKALDTWHSISNDSGLSKAELAYRWVAFNSVLDAEKGDGVIFGGIKSDHLLETIRALKAGPLPKEVADRIDAMWKDVEHEAPQDNYHSYTLKQKK